MASTTKGSIKISTANGIGAALVDVLGGEGYKPDEWEQNINLCGIHAADIESALENIEEDAGTGAERGSILLSTANAIGATLNKKFSTNRGFKPVEWESAISKLTPLAEGTVSGAICNIVNGAEDVPLKNWLVTLPASLDGYSEANGTKQKKNFYPIQIGADRFSNNGGATHSNNNGTLVITATTNNNCGVYINTNDALCELRNVLKWFYDNSYPRSISLDVKCSVDNATLAITSGTRYTFTMGTTKTRVSLVSTGANCSMYVQGADLGQSCTFEISNFQIEVGSTATTYEAYTAPTTYTASLGRTVYGADVDLVNGQGSETYGYIVFDGSDDENWGAYSAYNGYYIGISDMKSGTLQDGVCNQLTCSKSTAQGQTNAFWLGVGNSRLYVIGVYQSMGNTLEAFKAYLAENPLILVYPLATPTDFTFTPITPTPETALGVNNFWADEGESAVTYRKDLDIPDPVPGNLLGMNNGNNEENEEESEG